MNMLEILQNLICEFYKFKKTTNIEYKIHDESFNTQNP